MVAEFERYVIASNWYKIKYLIMALVLRHGILSQKKWFMQKFIVFHHNVNSYTYNGGYIKKFGSISHVRHFSMQNDEDSDRELVHKGNLTKRIRNTKIISFTTSVGSLIGQPIIYMKAIEDHNFIGASIILSLMSWVLICTPLLVHQLTKRYVIQMYYYPKEEMYAAEVFSFFFGKKLITFTRDDVDIPEMGGMISSCTINGYPLLFDESDFIDVRHYFIIMGYNEPVDFEMTSNISDTKVAMDLIQKKLKDTKKDHKQIESKQ